MSETAASVTCREVASEIIADVEAVALRLGLPPSTTSSMTVYIPAALYVAVAQVLAYVYQLKQAAAQGEAPPAAPTPEVDPDLMGPYRE